MNGQINLGSDGSFSGAAIMMGSVQRTGCVGSVAGGVLTITCGGTDPNSTQYCSATLTKTAATCP